MFERNSEAYCNGKRSVQQKRRTTQRNSVERNEKADGGSFGLECGSVCIGDVDFA